MANTAALARAYVAAKQSVLAAGFGPEILWQRSRCGTIISESSLLRESAWVILSSGMREAVIRSKFTSISLCFLDWRSAAEIDRSALLCFEAALRYFRHEAKIRAICSVASTIASRGFDGFMDQLRADPLYALQQFPFIGPITSLHLAKNLGIPLAKSDRHLSRLAESCGYTDPQLLCSNIAQFTGDPIDVVDIVLWRFAIITRAGYERFALMAGVAS
jgi:hypothetical protein